MNNLHSLLYDGQLAWRSITGTPVLSALIVIAVGIGMGVFMTIITVFSAIVSSPNPEKAEVLYTYELDDHLVVKPGQEEDDATPLISYPDALALLKSTIPSLQSIHYESWLVFRQDANNVRPFWARVRLATPGFFPLFDVPFLYGGPWSQQQEDKQAPVIVLTKELNDKLFGGNNNVGEQLDIAGTSFKVVGIMDEFSPIPRYFEFGGGMFTELEGALVPFSLTPVLKLATNGARYCISPPNEERGFEGALTTDCNWLNHWVLLPTQAKREAYLEMLNNYSLEQRRVGRFQGPFRNRLYNLDEWLSRLELVSPYHYILLGVAVMFLTVCLVNTNALLLAKFSGNVGTNSVRRALGCSKRRLFRQQLIEITWFGVAGGALGLALSMLGVLALSQLVEEFAHTTQQSIQLIGIAIITAVVSAIIAGLYPAISACQSPPAQYLRTQ